MSQEKGLAVGDLPGLEGDCVAPCLPAAAGAAPAHPGQAVVLSNPWCLHRMAVSRDGLAPEVTHKALLVTPQCGRAFTPPEPAR